VLGGETSLPQKKKTSLPRSSVGIAESVVDAALAVVKSTVAAGVALQLGVKASHLEDIKSGLELFKTYLTTTDEERSQDKMKMERVWARQVRDVAYDV